MTSRIAIIYSSLKGSLSVTSRITHRGVISLLVSALIFCPPAFGGATRIDSESKPSASPVGAIESLGAVKIDGRVARNGTALWGNESLQAPAIESARASLDGIGV